MTKTAGNGLGMGCAVIFVLTLSNLIISLVHKLIPSKVRIVCFIVIIATLVVAVELLMQAFAYPLYQRLGIFVPLIVVNCIVLGRAEAFASRNPVHLSVADALGIFLPLITTNCAILGIAVICQREDYEFLESIVFAVASGVGFWLALIILASIRERLETTHIPQAFRGTPIALVLAGLMSLAFFAFKGMGAQ